MRKSRRGRRETWQENTQLRKEGKSQEGKQVARKGGNKKRQKVKGEVEGKGREQGGRKGARKGEKGNRNGIVRQEKLGSEKMRQGFREDSKGGVKEVVNR